MTEIESENLYLDAANRQELLARAMFFNSVLALERIEVSELFQNYACINPGSKVIYHTNYYKDGRCGESASIIFLGPVTRSIKPDISGSTVEDECMSVIAQALIKGPNGTIRSPKVTIKGFQETRQMVIDEDSQILSLKAQYLQMTDSTVLNRENRSFVLPRTFRKCGFVIR